jgi:hypothetical protein
MDDADLEGAITRSLFRTDSDSDEEEQDEVVSNNEEALRSSEPSMSTSTSTSSTVRREIMHVVVEEQQTGGSIAHRLWPAAEYLANFVLAVVAVASSSRDGSDEKSLDSSCDKKELALEVLKVLLVPQNTSSVLPIIELGAGTDFYRISDTTSC